MDKREKLHKKIGEHEQKIVEHKAEISRLQAEVVELDKNTLLLAAMKSGLTIEEVITLIPNRETNKPQNPQNKEVKHNESNVTKFS
jgi:peptidoglycan hydrolase CwlO-like protein